MDILNALFPPETLTWLEKHGLATLAVIAVGFLLVLLLRGFVLWYFGIKEAQEEAKRLRLLAEKIHLELEVLNQTLRTPLKKAGVKTGPPADAQPAPAKPAISAEDRDAFLKALGKALDAEEKV